MKKRMTIAVIALAVLLAGLIGLVVKLEHDRNALYQDPETTGSQASADATGENSQDPGKTDSTDPQGTEDVPGTTGAEQTRPSEIENETPFVTAPEQDDSTQPQETEPEETSGETEGEGSNELPFVPA